MNAETYPQKRSGPQLRSAGLRRIFTAGIGGSQVSHSAAYDCQARAALRSTLWSIPSRKPMCVHPGRPALSLAR